MGEHRRFMTVVLTTPDETAATIEAARNDMEQRSARRLEVEQHLETCRECSEVLCAAGAELVRAALR